MHRVSLWTASVTQKITDYPAAVFCLTNVRASTGTGTTLKGNLNSGSMTYSKEPKKFVKTFPKAVGMMDSWHAAAREQDWRVISCFIAWSEWVSKKKKKKSHLAPELILLRTVLEVTVKSFTVSQTALRERLCCVLCVFSLPVPKRLHLHLTVISLVLADTRGAPNGFNSFLPADLPADPFRTHNRHKRSYLTLSC